MVTKIKIRGVFPCLGFGALFFSGCANIPKKTASEAWEVQRRLSEKEQLLSLCQSNGVGDHPENKEILEEIFNRSKNFDYKVRLVPLAEVGISSFFQGFYDISKLALDEAIDIIESKTSQSVSKKVLSVSGKEQEKVFKGEPFERAFIYFLRGLIYLNEGDFGNARACFKSAQIQDYRHDGKSAKWGDWPSLRFAEELTYFFQDGRGVDKGKVGVPKDLSFQFPSGNENLLYVIACGSAPQKIQENTKEKFELSYWPGITKIEKIIGYGVRGDLPVFSFGKPSEDLFVQAVSHGRREMDKVLMAKELYYKSKVSTGNAAEGVAFVSSQFGIWGLPVTLGAALLTLSSRKEALRVQKAADLRQIFGIPYRIYMGVAPVGKSLKVIGRNKEGKIIFEKDIDISGQRKVNLVAVRIFL